MAVGVSGVTSALTGRNAVREWTQARSASEGLKSAVYTYMSGAGTLDSAAARRRISELETDVGDLEH